MPDGVISSNEKCPEYNMFNLLSLVENILDQVPME
jgi:hypothetical protein